MRAPRSSHRHRHRRPLRVPRSSSVLLVLLVIATAAVMLPTAATATATASSSSSSSSSSSQGSAAHNYCASRDECCELCGAGSMRCARGPCSSAYVWKGLFSLSAPTESVSVGDALGVFYGMVPYLAQVGLALPMLCLRTWTTVFAFLFVPIFSALKVGIISPSIGDCAECARPCGSCLTNHGMPSGHATNAIGLSLWMMLEALLGAGRAWSWRRKAAWSAVIAAIFVPVPYSRVYLGDHTPLQVAIGSANGIVFAGIYFLLLRKLVARRLDAASRWIERRCCGLVIANDYSAPARPSLNAATLEMELLPPPPVARSRAISSGSDKALAPPSSARRLCCGKWPRWTNKK